MPVYKVDNLKNTFKDFLHREFSSYLKQNQAPLFSIILVGENFSSQKYIEMKLKMASELGIKTDFLHFPQIVNRNELEEAVAKYQKLKAGIIFQLPIRSDLLDIINDLTPENDLDLLGLRKYELLNQGFLPPTIGAIDLILKDIHKGNDILNDDSVRDLINQKLDLSGKIVGVIGQGKLVGNPLLDYLSKRNATILSINAETKNAKKLSKEADILISATGVGGLVDENWLQESYIQDNILYPIVLDAGTSEGELEHNHKTVKALIGDVNNEKVRDICTLVGVPGGVGPITVRYIFWNLLKLVHIQN